MVNWKTLGNIDPEKLEEARLQLHYASMLVASVGSSLANVEADDSHSALRYDEKHRALVGIKIEAETNFHAGISLENLALLLLDDDNKVLKLLNLDGHSFSDALKWLNVEIEKLDSRLKKIVKRDFPNFPEHEISSGAKFSSKESLAMSELAYYFHNANLLLARVVAKEKGASQLYTWPHHFDLATLITLQEPKDDFKGTFIGVGLSPGDSSYNQPYFYINPWPYPPANTLPAFEIGHWHTQNWTGCVLLASELVGTEYNSEQNISSFINHVIASAKELL